MNFFLERKTFKANQKLINEGERYQGAIAIGSGGGPLMESFPFNESFP